MSFLVSSFLLFYRWLVSCRIFGCVGCCKVNSFFSFMQVFNYYLPIQSLIVKYHCFVFRWQGDSFLICFVILWDFFCQLKCQDVFILYIYNWSQFEKKFILTLIITLSFLYYQLNLFSFNTQQTKTLINHEITFLIV